MRRFEEVKEPKLVQILPYLSGHLRAINAPNQLSGLILRPFRLRAGDCDRRTFLVSEQVLALGWSGAFRTSQTTAQQYDAIE